MDKMPKLESEKAQVLERLKRDDQACETDDDWDELDRAAELEEQKVFAEVAAAKVERAKIEARHLERERQMREAAAKELKREQRSAKTSNASVKEEDLTEEERLLRRAQVAARDGVQLRRTATMAVFLAALGVVEGLFGFLRSNMAVAAVGVILVVFCLAYYLKLRPRVKAAVEHFEILNAELEEYRANNPSASPEPDQAQ